MTGMKVKGAVIGLLAGGIVGAIRSQNLGSVAFFAAFGLAIGDLVEILLSLKTK
jgi:hypothetical protein